MIGRQVCSFIQKVLIFFIDRFCKECDYMLGNDRSYSERDSERGDLFVKQLIENIIHDRASKYDPYMVDGSVAISCGTTSVVLGKAHVTGLSSLHRTSICSLTEKVNRLFINANLGAGPLSYQRQIAVRFGNFERKAAILISLINIKVSFYFSVQKETGRKGLLLNFAINELNGFKLSVNGLGYFGWAINLFLSFWTLVLGRIIRNLLENELEDYILDRLPKYQFPVEGTLYRNENKFNNHQEGVQNNEASLSESFYLKQSHETPKLFRTSPIGKSNVYDGYNSAEYGTAKDLGSNQGIKTSRCFPETNKRTTEINSFDLPAQSLDLCSGSLNKSSCNEVKKHKIEEKCDLISELSRKTSKLSRSLNEITETLDSINHINNSCSKEVILKNCLNILDNFSHFGRNILGKVNDTDKVEYSESAISVTSPPVKDSENEQSFLICERRGKVKKSEIEVFHQKFRPFYRDQIKSTSEKNVNENPGRSKLLEEIFSEIHERSCKKNVNGNTFDREIKLPARVANFDSSPSTELKSSPIDQNILEPSSTETETFLNLTRNFDSKKRKAQIDYLEKMFNGKKRKERTEDSNKNHPVSAESCNHCQCPEGNFSARNFDLKLCSTEMFKNEPLIDDFEKHPKVSSNVFSPEYECQIEDLESRESYDIEKGFRNQVVKTPENQCISNSEDEVDGRYLLSSNIISHSMQQIIQDEKRFDVEADSEIFSTSLKFGEKCVNEANEKIPFKYVNFHAEEKLNEDSQLKVDEDCSADVRKFIKPFGFLKQSLDLCSGSLQNSCKEVSKIETEGKCDPFSVISRDALEVSRPSKTIRGKLDSNNHVTCSWFKESYLPEEMDIEYADSAAEFWSVRESKLNANSNKSGLKETPHMKPLHLLQEEIISKTRKLVSDVVSESDSEDNEYPVSIPISSYKNLQHQKDKSICNEVNQFQQKGSKTDVEVVSLKGGSPSLSVTQDSFLESETCSEWESTSESDAETSSETANESEHEV